MKKLIALLLCGLMLLAAGCQTQPEPTVGSEPTTVPTEPKQQTTVPEETTTEAVPVPKTKEATVLAVQAEILLTTADRGDTVQVVGAYDDKYMVVKTDAGYGMIEKRLLRETSEAEYTQWGGYARYGAKLYDHYHQFGEGSQALSMNTNVQILDDLGDCYVVQKDQQVGYMRHDDVSRSYIKPYTGGSGSSDGGDISLEFHGSVSLLAAVTPQDGEADGTAVVKVNEAEILIALADREETLQLVDETGFAEEKEGFYTVYLQGLYGYVRQDLVSTGETEECAAFDGYACSKAPVYSNYYLTGTPERTLSTNTAVRVVGELEQCYLVFVDEQLFYMEKDQISRTKIVYSGGGGGGEWTDPVM